MIKRKVLEGNFSECPVAGLLVLAKSCCDVGLKSGLNACSSE
jgi:hypothetical protein